MKINVDYKLSLSPLLFGYIEDDGILHFKHFDGIFTKELAEKMWEV